MAIHDVGDGRRLVATFRDLNGAIADPTLVTFRLTEPDGTTTEYVHGTDPELVRDATGLYHVDWIITKEGRHHYKWIGAGDVIAAEETSFLVRTSNIR